MAAFVPARLMNGVPSFDPRPAIACNTDPVSSARLARSIDQTLEDGRVVRGAIRLRASGEHVPGCGLSKSSAGEQAGEEDDKVRLHDT